ncbi:hypothetical protein WAI453_001700 [Rhynchosporium graminicola]
MNARSNWTVRRQIQRETVEQASSRPFRITFSALGILFDLVLIVSNGRVVIHVGGHNPHVYWQVKRVIPLQHKESACRFLA